jgi:hypothetical protein
MPLLPRPNRLLRRASEASQRQGGGTGCAGPPEQAGHAAEQLISLVGPTDAISRVRVYQQQGRGASWFSDPDQRGIAELA